MINIILVSAGIVLCIALSAFFSASEMSYSSCNTIRLENAKEEGDRKAALAFRITERFDDALGAVLICNNLVNIACSSLGSVLVILITGSDEKAWVSTVVITLLVIIFGETMPKICAKQSANRLAVKNSAAVSFLMIVLTPVIRIVVFLVDLLTSGMMEEEEEDPDEAVEELQSIIETAEDEEVLDEDRSELVQAAIDFSEISAYEVMTARVDVEAIDVDDDINEIIGIVENAHYSRIPVYEGGIDNIIGVLYLNHFLKALTEEESIDLRKLIMQPCYVYKTMKLPAVLSQMRKAKQHLAVVSDEYGGTLGVVSMEDVLEQIVGDIWDDTDIVVEEVVEKTKGCFELDGDMMLSDFLELMNIDEDSFEAESETVGGWTVERFERFPKVGDSFVFDGFTVRVLAMDGRRVEKVLVSSVKGGTV